MSSEVPANWLDKAPEKYDDAVAELDDFYGAIARDYLRETPQVREQSLAQMRDWIAKHPHIKKVRTDAPFLLRFLRSKKHNLIGACQQLERYLAVRVLQRKWCHRLDVDDPDISMLYDSGLNLQLPERDSKHRSVWFLTLSNWDPEKVTIHTVSRVFFLSMEAEADDNEFQCGGFVSVFDFANLSMAHVNMIGLKDLHTMSKVVSLLPLRAQELHIVNAPPIIMNSINMILKLLSEKFQKRFFFHRNWDELYTKVDRNLLPKEFGGKVPLAEISESYKNRIRKQRSRLLALDDMDMTITADSAHWMESNDGELEAGAIGSFRKLQVD